MVGEGAGIVIMEELEHARKRGAQIYAEMSGTATMGTPTISPPPRRTATAPIRCMKLALKGCGISPGASRLHQCPRHVDRPERRIRDAGDKTGIRREGLQDTGELDQIDDRPSSRRRRRGGGDFQRPRDPGPGVSPRPSTTSIRTRSATSTTCRTRQGSTRSTWPSPIPSASAGPTRSLLSGGTKGEDRHRIGPRRL